jgi:hypothetical protein
MWVTAKGLLFLLTVTVFIHEFRVYSSLPTAMYLFMRRCPSGSSVHTAERAQSTPLTLYGAVPRIQVTSHIYNYDLRFFCASAFTAFSFLSEFLSPFIVSHFSYECFSRAHV